MAHTVQKIKRCSRDKFLDSSLFLAASQMWPVPAGVQRGVQPHSPQVHTHNIWLHLPGVQQKVLPHRQPQISHHAARKGGGQSSSQPCTTSSPLTDHCLHFLPSPHRLPLYLTESNLLRVRRRVCPAEPAVSAPGGAPQGTGGRQGVHLQDLRQGV